MKATACSQWRRPPLFIGSKTQRSKFLNPTVKNRGRFSNLRGSFGIWRRGRRFLLPWFSIPRFRWLSFATTQAPRHRGASVGGIQNQAFRTLNCEIISVSQVQFKRFSCKTLGAFRFLFIFQNSSFDRYPSSPAGLSNKSRGSRFKGHRRVDCFSSRRSPESESYPPG
jgi:hypothetical protein